MLCGVRTSKIYKNIKIISCELDLADCFLVIFLLTQSAKLLVCGFHFLIKLKDFDLSLGVVVDSMHNIFQGVIKQHTELLLFGRAIDPWYRGSSRSKAIIIPSRISRYPRNIEDCKNCKASEWRNWLLYYSIFCLKDIIRQQDLDHWKLLSEAALLLHKSSITTDNFHTARDLFYRYIQKFQETFGKDFCLTLY